MESVCSIILCFPNVFQLLEYSVRRKNDIDSNLYNSIIDYYRTEINPDYQEKIISILDKQ